MGDSAMSMPKPRPLDTDDDNDFKKIVEIFLKQLCEKHPELKADIEKNKQTIIKSMCKVLKNRHDNKSFNTKDLADPEFVKELSIALVSVVTLTMTNEKNLLERLKLLFDPKNTLKNTKNTEKPLSPQEEKKTDKEIQLCCERMLADLKELKLTPSSPKEEMSEKEPDRYENLSGLANINHTGSIAAVVQCFLGNGLGFPDWNPNNGMANIDRQNNINEGPDPLGLYAATSTKFLQFLGDTFVDSFQNDLRDQGLAVSNTPTLHR